MCPLSAIPVTLHPNCTYITFTPTNVQFGGSITEIAPTEYPTVLRSDNTVQFGCSFGIISHGGHNSMCNVSAIPVKLPPNCTYTTFTPTTVQFGCSFNEIAPNEYPTLYRSYNSFGYSFGVISLKLPPNCTFVCVYVT